MFVKGHKQSIGNKGGGRKTLSAELIARAVLLMF